MKKKSDKIPVNDKVKVDVSLYDVLLGSVDTIRPDKILNLFGHACMVQSLLPSDDDTFTPMDMGIMIRYVLDNWDDLLPKADAHWKKLVEGTEKRKGK
jgi:hypothetical protein